MADPFFKITYDEIILDNDRYKKAVLEYIKNKMFDAARAFVRAAIPKVPVDTGMARGAFLNVGRLLNITIPINPKSNGKIYQDGALKLPKQPETGAQLAIHPSRVIRQEGDSIIFEFNQNIFHYNLNEFFGGHAPTAPWHSYTEGEAAFEEEFSRNFNKDFPQIKDYITKTVRSN